ncbi:MAG: AraC family transcriptional regulator [Lentimicrobiaceae bacterium]|nr:AraC family transcriptional regulator [Lentimicrobiaceae bacterium]
MLKKSVLVVILLSSIVIYGKNIPADSSQDNDIISKFKHLSTQQQLDTANYYHHKNSADTALICYSLIINTPVKDSDVEQQKRIIEAYNKSALIYQSLYDYRTSYEFLIKALILCEKANYEPYEPRIYNNIGNIYYRFNKFDLAKFYYTKALSLAQDTVVIVHLLSNLGTTEAEIGNSDSAFFALNKALQISKRNNRINFGSIMNNIALTYYNEKQYDSTFYYVKIALDEARQQNELESEAIYLSNFGHLFFEIKKIDSTLHYINLSNAIAEKNNFFQTLAGNYLLLSKIEKSKGRYKTSLEYFEMHARLRDSVFSTEKFGEINQLQHLYEISKANQQIEQLVVEQQIKERTIHYQKTIGYIIFGVLLLLSFVLLFIYSQKRNLSRAHRVLFEKNLEIINLQQKSSEKKQEKKKKFVQNIQDDLIDKILNTMEDTSIICDTDFSVDKLAVLVQSNYNYVSQTINNVLNKNFRSFLNGYRIREAQRLFSEPDAARYTIESVALQVGFKSRSAFRDAFKEVTGVSPNFYLQSMNEQDGVKNQPLFGHFS